MYLMPNSDANTRTHVHHSINIQYMIYTYVDMPGIKSLYSESLHASLSVTVIPPSNVH